MVYGSCALVASVLCRNVQFEMFACCSSVLFGCKMGVTRMEGSKITSKTSSLKALLLKAWRERWTDLQWGIHIKTILPRGVSGDVYNLADCILQQALIGSGPNHLVLSYLKHSLSSQLVSYAAVLQRIAKFDGFHKPHCVTCLLEFIESIQSGITCRGKPEEGILASSVLSLAHWLLQCYQHAATVESPGAMLSKPPVILDHMLNCNFLNAMLTLAKYDESDLYEEVVKKCHEITALHQQEPSPITPVPINESLMKLCKLGAIEPRSDVEPLTYILQPILAVSVMLNPCIDTNQLSNQIRLINKLKGYSGSRLACEVMRAALMNLNNAFESEPSKWGAFTFLNLPNILANLFPSNSEGVRSNEIMEGLEELLGYGPLIEHVDSAQNGKSLEALLSELAKINLISDQQLKSYITRREGAIGVKVDKLPAPTPLPIVIIKAQATLQRVLMTLDADNSKIQEGIIGVLCQVLTGKSFELILAVASVEGKLQSFVSKLIRFNEFSKAGATARPVLFDITFIMLTYIVQIYGSKDVFSKGREESFFEIWSAKCLVERGSPKCPDDILEAADPTVVETLLNMLNSAQPPDILACGISCDALCQSMPGVMKEVLVAWEHDALSATDVKRILDNLKHGLCCLAICAATWLCTYMQMLEQDALLKPMNMVQQLLCVGVGGIGGGSACGDESSPSGPAPTTPPPPPDSLRERSILMSQVIRKIQYDVHLIAPHTKLKPISQTHGIITKEPLSEELGKVWEVTLERGMLSMQSCRQLENLFYTAGPEWFVTNLIAELMKVRYKRELDKAVDIVTAIFHIDIETCTQVLFNKLIPDYLHLSALHVELMEPQSECLARLAVYCLYSSMEQPIVSSSRKRPAPPSHTQDVDEMVLVGGKLSRLDEAGQSKPGAYSEPEPISSWLGKLLKLFNSLVENATHLSQSTLFVFTFLRLLTLDSRTQPDILHLIPATLVRGLVRLVPDQFTERLLLSLYDVSSASGRRSAASDLCLLRNIELKPPL